MTPHHPNQSGGPTDLPNQPVYYHTIIPFARYVQQASLLIPQKHQDFFCLLFYQQISLPLCSFPNPSNGCLILTLQTST